ncbi:MAG TPA: hypothetical protein VJ835_06065, partial [Fimbriimonadaceae bacterium]|nr:hypothetical protein [Fimbriimonadaceae bacterium]
LASVVPMAASANLVLNGDFEQGNTLFTSSHILVIGTGTALFPEPPVVPANGVGGVGNENMYNEGTYTVTNDEPGAWHALWRNDLDLTNHNRYLLVNGDTSAGTTVWTQNIAGLVNGQQYRLSMDLANVLGSGTAAAHLTLSLGSATLIDVFAPTGAEQWKNVFADFSFPGGGSNASILNAVVAFEGNDFAIDNISLEPVPEPFTVGLGALGLAAFMRKRAKKAKA